MESVVVLTWLGIALCVLQSGSFSGLNLSLFGVSALQLRAKAAAGDADAERLLALREDPNFLLTTVLWGNVGTNVLLALLTDSVLAGATGFLFSTFVITLGGEIAPQAYFSRNALRMATLMKPFLRFWQVALYPLAKPTALLLDKWLGGESMDYLAEVELREVIKRYVAAPTTDVGRVEGLGVLNFLALDDLSVWEEGVELDPRSVVELPEEGGQPVFPAFARSAEDPFLKRVDASGKKWVVITSPDGEPHLVLDADEFLRDALLRDHPVRIEGHCHRPIVVRGPEATIEDVLPRLRSERRHAGGDVVEEDLILVWGPQRRIITGADILGRLLRGIARSEAQPDR